jgi:hypothetical protein
VKLLAFAGALTLALAARPTVAQRPSLDSTQTRLLDRLVALRDTTQSVHTAIVGFRRDLKTAGPETVVAKAEHLVATCARARDAVLNAVPAFDRRAVPRSAGEAADTVRASARRLARSLDDLCVRGLSPTGPGVRADSIRAWGPYRTAQLRLVLDRFHSNLHSLAGASRLKLPPTAR